jgi:hypothetical protein
MKPESPSMPVSLKYLSSPLQWQTFLIFGTIIVVLTIVIGVFLQREDRQTRASGSGD